MANAAAGVVSSEFTDVCRHQRDFSSWILTEPFNFRRGLAACIGRLTCGVCRTRWLWFRAAHGLHLEPPCVVVVRGGRCQRTGVAQVPYNCCPRWRIMSCCVHQLKHCNCGASGARHAEPILLKSEIYMNL